jgi:hypothetical protein
MAFSFSTTAHICPYTLARQNDAPGWSLGGKVRCRTSLTVLGITAKLCLPVALSSIVMNDNAVGHDLPSPAVASHDQPTPFTMPVETAVLRYAQLGHPRNPRSVRRFCKQGTIDCRKVQTSNFSELYLIDPASIDRHVKEISETFSVQQDLAAHDPPSPAIAGHDLPGPGPKAEYDSRYVALLEKINTDQADQLKTKDQQLKIKDTQIVAMLERDRETNFLIRGLQTLLGLPEKQESDVTHASPKETSTQEPPLSPGV